MLYISKVFSFFLLDSIVRGVLRLPLLFQGDIPQGSCLVVEARRDENCSPGSSCVTPVIASTVMRDIKPEQGSIDFSMTIPSNASGGSYSFTTTLNMGWCGQGQDTWIKTGDYLNRNEAKYEIGFEGQVKDFSEWLKKYAGLPDTKPSGEKKPGKSFTDNFIQTIFISLKTRLL